VSFPVSALTRKDTENAGNLIFLPPPKKILAPYLPTYLPTMESSNYEKQIFLYGRRYRDVVGCGVGRDGRSGR